MQRNKMRFREKSMYMNPLRKNELVKKKKLHVQMSLFNLLEDGQRLQTRGNELLVSEEDGGMLMCVL